MELHHTDPIRLALTTVDPDEMMNGLARLTVEVFLVICRQVKDYHGAGEGALLELPPEGSKLRTNIQADNMTAESILGLADHLKQKSPNTTTSDWLEKIQYSAIYHLLY